MQFIDLKAQYRALKNEIDNSIQSVLDNGQFISGKEVGELEKKLTDFVGVKHCITCANGTDALQIAYMVYGVGDGDAVFCPDITFIASVEPAMMLGATPVFCDITKDTYNLSPESLEKQIEAVISEGKLKPKAVVAVDFLGNPADFDSIKKICDKYGLVLIEDAAQGFGAVYKGKRCGSLGDIAITSFFPAKPLGCYGDGGAIFTDNNEIADLCRSICVHGKGPMGKYNNIRIGVNSRLDTIQAAVLLPKLKAFEAYEIDSRQKVVSAYNNEFKDEFTVPYIAPDTLSVYAQYALLAKDEATRDNVLKRLNENKIPNMVYYPTPMHKLPVFEKLDSYSEEFTNSIDYCKRTFSLPMHPYLEAEEQSEIISAVLG